MFWRKGNVPELLYELLPVIYMLVGAWVLFVGEGVLAVISGGLLCLASVLVFLWRRDARPPVSGGYSNAGYWRPGQASVRPQ